MSRTRRFLALAGLMLGLSTLGVLADLDAPALGATPEGAGLTQMQASPHFDAEARIFRNASPAFGMGMSGNGGTLLREYLADTPRRPTDALPAVAPDLTAAAPDGFRVTWLGHSTLLVELDGATILTDPQWSERASPFRHLGPRRFSPPPLPLEDLPRVDAVVISHDHYDHLDRATVVALAERVPQWIVPLGVGAHLAKWGVPAERIVERDWWEGGPVGTTGVTLTAVPAQHFSGRGLTDRFATFWASWVVTGPRHRFFFSGDTGYHADFVTIAEKLGPFDLVALEVGAWNAAWESVHMGPEGALRAAEDLGGAPVLPIHWATFDLATHAWKWPIEELTARGAERGLTILTPRLGGSVTMEDIVTMELSVVSAGTTSPLTEGATATSGVAADPAGDGGTPAKATQPTDVVPGDVPRPRLRPRDPSDRWWESLR
jgi:L-ascorbate metabolism protein UlaG (beta-lactamase superfamily)